MIKYLFTVVGPVCGKHFLKAEKRIAFNETITTSAALEFHQSPSDDEDDPRKTVQGPILVAKAVEIGPQSSRPSPPDSVSVVEAIKKDITAFKRVAWRDLVR